MANKNSDKEKVLLESGGTISYSAGSSKLDPLSFRVVEDGSAKIASAVTLFPKLGKYFQSTPVVLNCYPATLGAFQSVIYLDTYLRPVNFSRGLMLAENLNTACIVLGQPLTVLDLLLKHSSSEPKLPLPTQILFALGGYYAPASFEKTLSDLLTTLNVEHNLLHAYGMAEIDFGCLLGVNRNKAGNINYKIANPDVLVELHEGKLSLGRVDQNYYQTSDSATWQNDSLIISPGNQRLSPEMLKTLESWDNKQWKRRTGHVGKTNGELIFQLREDVIIEDESEMKFHAFSKTFNMSWQAKPNWSVSR